MKINQKTAVILAAIIGALAVLAAAYISKSHSQNNDIQLTGRVVDAKTAAPVHRAKVSVELPGVPQVLTTDSDGIYYLDANASIQVIHIRVDADGYEVFDRNVSMSRTGIETIPLIPARLPNPTSTSSAPVPLTKPVPTKTAPLTHLIPYNPPPPSPENESHAMTIPPHVSPTKRSHNNDFLTQTSTVIVDLYGHRSDSTAHIRKAFDKLFSEQDKEKLAGSKAYFKNYYRFCYFTLPLHADGFNQWFEQSSPDTKHDFFLGMKKAVLSDNFDEIANQQIDKINPDFEFTMIGDLAINSSVIDKIMQTISSKN